MYDERTMQELERNFNSSQPSCQLLIAGHLYDIDFRNMLQRRVNNSNLFRRIKRDLASAEKRGIAGIRLNSSGSLRASSQQQSMVGANNSNRDSSNCTASSMTTVTAGTSTVTSTNTASVKIPSSGNDNEKDIPLF